MNATILTENSLIRKMKKRITQLQNENTRLRIQLNLIGWENRMEEVGSKSQITEEIIQAVCKYYDTTIEVLANAGRKRELVSARFILCHLLYREAFLSLKNIGNIIGGRDHTTVLHAIRQIDIRIIEEFGYPEFIDYYNIKKTLKNDTSTED